MGTFSYTFLVFFTATLLACLIAPARLRPGIVLLASVVFFLSYGPGAVLPMVVYLAHNFFFARAVVRTRPVRTWLVVALIFNILFLAAFKYLDLFVETVAAVVPLPSGIRAWSAGHRLSEFIGISYITFSVMAYQIDLYRGQAQPASLHALAQYVLFFPKLVAGPIVRPDEFMAQAAKKEVALDVARFERGLLLFVVGMSKKYLVADQLARHVDAGFGSIDSLPCLGSWLVMWAFAIQIYCDFAGYTDMARGLACLLGFELPRNFRSPYMTTNVSDFWSRWHMSLTRWFTHYLFIPLGGSRGGRLKTYRNLVIVMGLCGFWHGAQWTFLFWGVYHGLLLVGNHLWRGWTSGKERWTQLKERRWYQFLAGVLTFHLVTVGWVFFRAGSFGDAWRMLGRMFGAGGMQLARSPISAADCVLVVAALAFSFAYTKLDLPALAGRVPRHVRVALATILALCILAVRVPVKEFIYAGF